MSTGRPLTSPHKGTHGRQTAYERQATMMVPGDGTPEGVWQDDQCEGCAMPSAGIYREEWHAYICDEHMNEVQGKRWLSYEDW